MGLKRVFDDSEKQGVEVAAMIPGSIYEVVSRGCYRGVLVMKTLPSSGPYLVIVGGVGGIKAGDSWGNTRLLKLRGIRIPSGEKLEVE